MTASRAMPALRRILKNTFGLSRLRGGQEEVVRSVLEGRDTLAIMPTGAGKSLCYQLPALHLPGTTLVVSPLIALMKDQREKMEALGLPAIELNSTLSRSQEEDALARLRSGKTEFVFVTPERLATPAFLEEARRITIDLLVIDEAHCISQWGHDFRPAYLELAGVITTLGHPRVLALTATATPEVVADIRSQLGLEDLAVIDTGIYRKNLELAVTAVQTEDDKLGELAHLIEQQPGAGIVYTATVKQAGTVHEALVAAGVPCVVYHGKLGKADRARNQDAFMSGAERVVVATNAFGLGIDKADIRWVIHHSFPGSLEAYYQEAGRAGRDGQRARCTLLFARADKRIQSFFLAGKYPTAENIRLLHGVLRDQAALPLPDIQERAQGLGKAKVRSTLAVMKEQGLVNQLEGPRFELARAKMTASELDAVVQAYEERARNDQAKLKQMIAYGQTALCRWKVLLGYFEEAVDFERCGHCDSCEQHPDLAAGVLTA